MATSQGLSLKVISLGMTGGHVLRIFFESHFFGDDGGGHFSRIIFESHFFGDDGWPRLKDYL